LLIKPIAVILVASGHGLIAVINPSNRAVTHGIELLSRRFVRNSMPYLSICWFITVSTLHDISENRIMSFMPKNKFFI
jgi:hypothetical protein